MDIDRRKLLVVGAAVGAATALPALPAQTHELRPLSPLFGASSRFLRHVVQIGEEPVPPGDLLPFDIARFYSGKAHGDPAKVYSETPPIRPVYEKQLLPTKPERRRWFATVEQAEDWYLDQLRHLPSAGAYVDVAHVGYDEWADRNTGRFICGGGFASPPILINRQFNYIAQRTRRGAGNVILAPPSLVERITPMRSFNTNAPLPQPTGNKIGRWTEFRFVFTNRMWEDVRLYTSDHLSDDFAFTLYNGGPYDAPAGLSSALGGGYTLADRDPKAGIGSALDYGGRVRFDYSYLTEPDLRWT